ncbi:MAG TPA: hypothetical protein VF718_12770 [Allosphingosinicella sp.]|jgi:hypothetical protein
MATPQTRPKASETSTNVPPPAKKYDADSHDRHLRDFSPENRVAYRQAKLALVQAQAAYEAAVRAAEEEQSKPRLAFEAAKDYYIAAKAKLEGDLKSAQRALARIRDEADVERMKESDPPNPQLADKGKAQVAKLQGLLDEYKTKVAAVAAQIQAIDEAAAVLQKLSEPEGFDPENPTLNKMTDLIANEQKELAIVQAQIPLDAAIDAFELKLAELKGSQARPMH